MPHLSNLNKRESGSGNKPTVTALFQAAGQTIGSVAVPSSNLGALAGPEATGSGSGQVHPSQAHPSQAQSQSHPHSQHLQAQVSQTQAHVQVQGQAQSSSSAAYTRPPTLDTSLSPRPPLPAVSPYLSSASTVPRPAHLLSLHASESASSTPSQASYALSASASASPIRAASHAIHHPPPVATYGGVSGSASGAGSFAGDGPGPESLGSSSVASKTNQSQHFATSSRIGTYSGGPQMPPQASAWQADELHMSATAAAPAVPGHGHQQHSKNPQYSLHDNAGATTSNSVSSSSHFLPSLNLKTSPTSYGPSSAPASASAVSSSSSAGPHIKLEEGSSSHSQQYTQHQHQQQQQQQQRQQQQHQQQHQQQQQQQHQQQHQQHQHHQAQQYHQSSSQLGSVPSILQPAHGNNMTSRPPNMSTNTAPQLPPLQGIGSPQQQLQSPQSSQIEYSGPSKPSLSISSSHSHGYSRSSPSTNYESPSSNYMAYTPTTPSGGPSSSQYMSPSESKYAAPGSQRNISNTPLGLADIRPRTDSSLSDGVPGTLAYELANPQPGTSNYLAPWALYAFDWCRWAPQGNSAGKVAVGSYLEDGHNFIQILDTQLTPTTNDSYQQGSSKYEIEFNRIAEATHSYPVTRLLWEPPSAQKQSTDLLATSGDHLRLWSLPSDAPTSATSNSITGRQREMPVTKLTPLALLSNSKTPDHTAPLTSLDWNTVSPSLIITSSIDTTCTIWDIPSLTAKTQLIAHDKEVYDVRFCSNSVDVFVSCGQDGSVRMFDLRSLEHSTIIYEPTSKDDRMDADGGRISPTLAQQTMSHPPPLMRLATSPHDTHLLATFAQDSNVIRILDVRQPGQALLELRGHAGSVNCVEWSPHRRGTLASGADDSQVHIWDIMTTNGPYNMAGANGASNPDAHRSPVASWQCDYEVGNVGWLPRLPGEYGEWLGVSGGRGVWGVRV